MSRVDLNTVLISGNIVKDAYTSPTGKVVKFAVMVHDGDKGQSCIPCEAIGSLIDIAKCLQKGDFVTVAGRIKQSSYERQADKVRVNVVEVTASVIAVGGTQVIAAGGQLDDDEELFPGDNAAKQEGYSALE